MKAKETKGEQPSELRIEEVAQIKVWDLRSTTRSNDPEQADCGLAGRVHWVGRGYRLSPSQPTALHSSTRSRSRRELLLHRDVDLAPMQAPAMSGGRQGAKEGGEKLRANQEEASGQQRPLWQLGQGVCTAKMCNHHSGRGSYAEEHWLPAELVKGVRSVWSLTALISRLQLMGRKGGNANRFRALIKSAKGAVIAKTGAGGCH